MGAVLLGDHFANRVVAAVEVPDVARADAEEAGNTEGEFGRLRRRYLNAGIRETEGRAGERSAALPSEPESAVQQERGGVNIAVVHGDVLHAHLIAVARGREQVRSRNHRRLVEIGEKVTAAELMLAQVVVGLDHELVLRLSSRGTREGELPAGAVGKRDFG